MTVVVIIEIIYYMLKVITKIQISSLILKKYLKIRNN